MHRTPSRLAQVTFDAVNRLQILSMRSNLAVQEFGRIFRWITFKFLPIVGAGHTVDGELYGRRMRMPTEHPLPAILQNYPQYNRPLALAVKALGSAFSGNAGLAVIDVGANIGETVAVIEQLTPNVSYLCIEADQDIARICQFNHRDNVLVQTVQCFIGEQEGALVHLQDDGRANPSTKLASQADLNDNSHHGRLMRLDTVARSFAEDHNGLSLIKVDTEGYDFSVLRSGQALLERYRPALYFEWFPELLIGLQEQVWDGFDYLEKLGYKHFVFFSGQGDYYCHLSNPDHFTLTSLASTASQNKALLYFDVFASNEEAICKKLVELTTKPLASPRTSVREAAESLR
jgi:FkbM family methyltransferase